MPHLGVAIRSSQIKHEYASHGITFRSVEVLAPSHKVGAFLQVWDPINPQIKVTHCTGDSSEGVVFYRTQGKPFSKPLNRQNCMQFQYLVVQGQVLHGRKDGLP